MDNDEPELIAQIVSGDQERFATLVDRYKDDVYRHCFYIIRDEDVAEDMAQEAFIKAFTHLSRYSADKAGFKTWLFRIATRECLSYLRRRKNLPLENEDLLASNGANPEQRAEANETYEAVMRLRPNYRTAIALRYWHGYSYEAIASAMNAPISSVRAWIFRAKKELKEALS